MSLAAILFFYRLDLRTENISFASTLIISESALARMVGLAGLVLVLPLRL